MNKYYVSLITAFIVLLPGSLLRSQWTHLTGPDGGNIHCFAVYESMIFTGTDSGVFYSHDYGENWSEGSNGLKGRSIYSLAFSTSDLLAGSDSGWLFFTSHLGASWTVMNAGLNGYFIRCLAVGPPPNTESGPVYYAGTSGGGLYRLTDWGGYWTPMNTGLDDLFIKSLVVNDTILYVVTEAAGVYRSPDRGEHWSAANSGIDRDSGSATSAKPIILTLNDSGLFAGVAYSDTALGGGVYRYSESTAQWTGPLAATGFPVDFASSDSSIVLSTSRGVYLSRDGGLRWLDVTSNLPIAHPGSVAICDSFMFAGNELGIWRCPFSAMTTSAQPIEAGNPAAFRLGQNYPNPFSAKGGSASGGNPTTSISYRIHKPGNVTLVVYDMLGREVKILVNELKEKGIYQVTLDGSRLSSGVYFYRLVSGSFSQTKRLLILK